MTGTLNLLEFSQEIKPKVVVYSQSIADVAYLCGDKNRYQLMP